MVIIMGFGNTLSNLLKSKNMTVAELAKKTGISSSTLYAIIRRDSDNVNLSAIQKIAHELNVSVETLIPSKNPQHLFSQILDFSDDFFDTENNIIDIHFSTDEFTPEELEEIIQFSEFIKQRRKTPFRKPPTTE